VPILSQRALLPLLLARTPAELGAASVVHGGFRQVAGHHIRHGGRRGGAPPRRATPAAHCLSPSPALSPRRPRRELSPGKGASSLVRCIGSCGGPSRIPLDPPRYEGSRGGRRLFPGLLQATAAAHLPAKLTGIRMAGVFPDTGAGGLIAARSDPSPSSC
jgi:hypothetical protein